MVEQRRSRSARIGGHSSRATGGLTWRQRASWHVARRRLRTRSEDRVLPAAEGLAAHDRPGDRAVDVEIARLDAVNPARDLAVVERLDPARQPERGGVRERDGLVEIRGAHESQHGAEAPRAVEERARPPPELDPGRPEARVGADLARLEQPRLALVERRERAAEVRAGHLRERRDAARRFPGRADGELAAASRNCRRNASSS
jgi:hypothetical protein